jgi:parallel beta-helix repeat protein
MCADEVYRGGPYLRRLTVVNNVVAGCQRGFSFSHWKGAMRESALKESLIANNTLVDNDVGISLDETPDTTLIANNIVLQRNGKPCVQVPNGDVSVVNPQWRNNVFFGRDPRCFFWPQKGLDFEQWAKAIQQAESLWADPGLVDATGNDVLNYRLRPGSVCIDRGAPVAGLDHDARGNTRPRGRKIDIGAFEFEALNV